MKKKTYISITPPSVELKISTSNMIFQTYAEKRKVIKQQHQKKTETNTHLST